MQTIADIDRFFLDIDQNIDQKKFVPYDMPVLEKEYEKASHPKDRILGSSTKGWWGIKEKFITVEMKISWDIKNLFLKIDSLQIPSKWHIEGINPPTIECKNLAKTTVEHLHSDFIMSPERISPTIEEGVFVKYVNYKNYRELSIEIYNDLDMVALVTTQDGNIIVSEEIVGGDFSDICRIFQEI